MFWSSPQDPLSAANFLLDYHNGASCQLPMYVDVDLHVFHCSFVGRQQLQSDNFFLLFVSLTASGNLLCSREYVMSQCLALKVSKFCPHVHSCVPSPTWSLSTFLLFLSRFVRNMLNLNSMKQFFHLFINLCVRKRFELSKIFLFLNLLNAKNFLSIKWRNFNNSIALSRCLMMNLKDF